MISIRVYHHLSVQQLLHCDDDQPHDDRYLTVIMRFDFLLLDHNSAPLNCLTHLICIHHRFHLFVKRIINIGLAGAERRTNIHECLKVFPCRQGWVVFAELRSDLTCLNVKLRQRPSDREACSRILWNPLPCTGHSLDTILGQQNTFLCHRNISIWIHHCVKYQQNHENGKLYCYRTYIVASVYGTDLGINRLFSCKYTGSPCVSCVLTIMTLNVKRRWAMAQLR